MGYFKFAMLRFLKRLLSKRQETPIDPDEIMEELWVTDFADGDVRFGEESGEGYDTTIDEEGLVLTLSRKNVYAWTVNPLYRYKNAVIETRFSHKPGETASGKAGETASGNDDASPTAGTGAFGVLFRHINDSTFYSVLVSDRGYARMDAVVNGTPLPVLGWTETAAAEGDDVSLRVIVRDTSVTITVNDRWVAECEDDTIQAAGNVAVAGQLWGREESASARITSFAVESRPLDVEAIYTRWNQYLPVPAEAHVALAETWSAMGRHVPALVELRKAWNGREATVRELLLASRICLAQRLVTEAEGYARSALELSGGGADAVAELAGILYYRAEFAALDALLAGLPREPIESSAFLSNIEGHLLHWKGRHADAAAAYERAGAIAPDQGLFFLHAGTEWSLSGDTESAVESWLKASRAFLSSNETDDLGDTVRLLSEARPDDVRVLGARGKYLYAIDDEEGAEEALAAAISGGSGDSADYYLHGMILRDRGDADAAIDALTRATELEPDCGLYRFRLAETLFNEGRDADGEIALALEKDPDSGWAHNLAALAALDRNDVASADAFLTRARSLLPGELDILVNFAEARRRQGRLDEALRTFDKNDADALHAGANLLVEDGRNEDAEEWYREALHRRPFDPELLADRAANCIELDLINEADDLLGRAHEIEPSARIYLLIAFLATRKGEFARAEVSLQQGLAEFGDDPDLLSELCGVYMTTGRQAKASDTAKRLREAGFEERALEVERDILDAGTYPLACAECGRTWRVPKDIPPQGSLRITDQPPDDLPAGTCPVCERHYCIGCARETLDDDGRFRCKTCGSSLKLIDQGVIWLLNRWQETSPA